jgi:hypothetical protein
MGGTAAIRPGGLGPLVVPPPFAIGMANARQTQIGRLVYKQIGA